MKRLILMRHAKSDWSIGMADIDRPLNGRGTRSAKALGDWLRDNDYLPGQVLCSSAQRTQDTLAGLQLDAQTEVLKSLYLAEPADILAALKDAKADCVLVLCHNPGVAELAHRLVRSAPKHDRFADYPTCATLVVDLPTDDWSAITPGTGEVVDFAVGRDFTD